MFGIPGPWYVWPPLAAATIAALIVVVIAIFATIFVLAVFTVDYLKRLEDDDFNS